jgi:hypothetical protein
MNYYYYILLFIFLIIIYASLYYIYNDELIIYQVEASHFDFNLLYTKQPIIIQDSIKNIDDILVNWFNYNIIEYDVNIQNISNWNINNFKYFLIYADAQEENSVEITLGNPLTKHENNVPISPDMISDYNQKLTTILLNKNKLLIIPFKWFYHLNIISGNPQFFGIHDYITYGLSFGIVKRK